MPWFSDSWFDNVAPFCGCGIRQVKAGDKANAGWPPVTYAAQKCDLWPLWLNHDVSQLEVSVVWHWLLAALGPPLLLQPHTSLPTQLDSPQLPSPLRTCFRSSDWPNTFHQASIDLCPLACFKSTTNIYCASFRLFCWNNIVDLGF